jgi:hypothetical protein
MLRPVYAEELLRRLGYIAIWVALALAGGAGASGQEIRAANGAIIKGQMLKATDAGLEVQTQTGPRPYTWDTLSPATRYRLQPIFRANYEAILARQPPSERIPLLDEAPKSGPEPATNASAETAETTAQPVKTFLLFDQAQYENLDPIAVNQFPALPLRTPSLAAYLGLQYGVGVRDVIYLALDTKGPGEPFDILYVYSPTVAAYTNPVKITGFKRGSTGPRAVTYKKLELSSSFGQIAASFEVECGGAPDFSNLLSLTVSALLTKDEAKSRFVLMGQLANLVQGDGIIGVSGLLDLPVLWVSLDSGAEPPSLVGNLNMARLKIIPKEGMDSRVTITITDSNGETVQREAIKIDESIADSRYSISCPLKKLTPGQTYNVRATINLGPFFGPLSFEDTITLPGASGS